ncbi:MAG: hypothetical protein ACOCZV_01110 [Nanoarchaeota archaeon]
MDKNSVSESLTRVSALYGFPSTQVWQFYDSVHSNMVSSHIKRHVCDPKESRPELDEEFYNNIRKEAFHLTAWHLYSQSVSRLSANLPVRESVLSITGIDHSYELNKEETFPEITITSPLDEIYDTD